MLSAANSTINILIPLPKVKMSTMFAGLSGIQKHLKTVTEHFVKNQATIKLDAAPMGYTPPKVCGSKLYGETEARFKDLNRAIQLIAHSPRTKFSCFDFPLPLDHEQPEASRKFPQQLVVLVERRNAFQKLAKAPPAVSKTITAALV